MNLNQENNPQEDTKTISNFHDLEEYKEDILKDTNKPIQQKKINFKRLNEELKLAINKLDEDKYAISRFVSNNEYGFAFDQSLENRKPRFNTLNQAKLAASPIKFIDENNPCFQNQNNVYFNCNGFAFVEQDEYYNQETRQQITKPLSLKITEYNKFSIYINGKEYNFSGDYYQVLFDNIYEKQNIFPHNYMDSLKDKHVIVLKDEQEIIVNKRILSTIVNNGINTQILFEECDINSDDIFLLLPTNITPKIISRIWFYCMFTITLYNVTDKKLYVMLLVNGKVLRSIDEIDNLNDYLGYGFSE